MMMMMLVKNTPPTCYQWICVWLKRLANPPTWRFWSLCLNWTCHALKVLTWSVRWSQSNSRSKNELVVQTVCSEVPRSEMLSYETRSKIKLILISEKSERTRNSEQTREFTEVNRTTEVDSTKRLLTLNEGASQKMQMMTLVIWISF